MFKNLLLAIDLNDTQGAARPAQVAVEMAKAQGGVLHVLNVIPDTGMAIVAAMLPPGQPKAMLEQAQREMTKWRDDTVPNDLETHVHIARGTIYDEIIKTANSVGADAIVVGANRPELQDYLIGPNAARVARHATQSVFVIR